MHNRPFLRSTAAILAFSLNEWSPACASLTSAPAHARHSTSAAHEDLLWMRSGSPHRLPSPHRRKKQPSNTSPWLKVAVKARGGGGSGRQVSRGNHQQQQPAAASTSSIRRSAKICTLFALSYICSIGFNINNKRALLLVPLPWTYAALNLLVGSTIALASWSAKAAPWPKMSLQEIGILLPMGLFHAISHLTVVLGLGAGAISFSQTVKASEVCFTALLSFLFLGKRLPLPVYLTLLPVVAGVGVTCCNQVRFSWMALFSALLSNFSNALRNVLIVKHIGPAAARNRQKNENTAVSPDRRTPTNYQETTITTTTISNNPIARGFESLASLRNTRAGAVGTGQGGIENLAPGDTYRLLTLIGAVVLLPTAACFERASWPKLWRGAVDAAVALFRWGSPTQAQSTAANTLAGAVAVSSATGGNWAEAFRHALTAGVCFNLFYYLTFKLLGQLHPVTHAVGNTVKRVVVIAAGAVVFGGDLGGARGAMGSALAVAGVFGYSLAKAWCKPVTEKTGGS